MADLILYNAAVITMDPLRPTAELVAVEKGRITAVSGNHGLKALKTKRTRVVDCAGRTVLPGFIDAHCHLGGLAESLVTLDLNPVQGVHTIRDLQARIRDRARVLPEGTWIRAHGYHQHDLAEKRHPTRLDLDEAAPRHPVRLSHRTGHAHVLNSLALELVGLTRETADPEGGLMDRSSETGDPTGLLYEMGGLLAERVSPLSGDEMEQGIRATNRLLLSRGVTSIHEASSGNDLSRWEQVLRWKEEGLLLPRVGMMFGTRALGDLLEKRFSSPLDEEDLRPLGLKIILDETTGRTHPPQHKLNLLVSEAHRLGIQVAIHAVEEEAVESACTALDHALRTSPRPNHRHRLEHCFLCPPRLGPRLASLGAVVVTQPAFLYHNGDRYLETVPKDRQPWLYPLGTFIRCGIPVAAGSDSPVGPLDPLLGIYGAVFRRTRKDAILNQEERIPLLAALALYTSGAARAGFEEGLKGSITPGKRADLILLNGDLGKAGGDEMRGMQVDLTVLGGGIAWERESQLITPAST